MTGTVNGSPPASAGRRALRVAAEQNGSGTRPHGVWRPRFLQDKLGIPEPSFAVLHRGRVSALLDEATRHRVTLVCGPAGAGKSVACAAWATSGPAAGRVAWVTLDTGDRRDWFWAYVSAALRRVSLVPAEALETLADTPPERVPLRLAELAQTFGQPVVLMLDGIHEVTDGSVLAGLDVLIRHAPPGLRLVMLARRPPDLQLARLRVAGELADISGTELACTADEADAYFSMLDMRVAAAERNEVLRRTEGWMAGLRLAAMRAGEGGGGGRVTALAGDEPLVTDYMWDEVLAQQDPRTRDFLMRTSIMDELSGDLADALTRGTGGDSLLARLSRENSFVSGPVEDGGYRYHPLLREVLSAKLHRELGHEVPVLLRRAAHWYSGAGLPLDAVRCAAEAEDWDLAARALAEAGADAVLSRGPAELEDVLGLFPADRVAGDVAVATAWACARLWRGDVSEAAGHLASAGRALAGADQATRRIVEPTLLALRIMHAAGSAEVGAGSAEVGAGSAGIDVGPSGVGAGSGGPGLDGRGEARELCGAAAVEAERVSAAATTQAEHRAAGLLWFALGVTSLARLETVAARHALGRADRQLGSGGLTILQMRARGWLALALACCGELTAAGQAADEVRKPGTPAAPPAQGRAAASLAALAFAQVSIATDDLMTAQRLLDEVDQSRVTQLPGEPPVPAVAYLLRARILLADGDADAAGTALSRLRDTWLSACPGLGLAVTVAEAEVALRSGDPGRARALLLLAADGGPGRADASLVQGGLLLAEGDFAAAIEVVGPLLAGAAIPVSATVHAAAAVPAVPGAAVRSVPGVAVPEAVSSVPGAAISGAVPGVPGVAVRSVPAAAVPAARAGAKAAGTRRTMSACERIGALLVATVARRRLGETEAAAGLAETALGLAEAEGAYRVFLDGGAAVRSAITVLVPPTSRYAGFAGRVLERFDTQGPRSASGTAAQDVRLTDSERAVLCFLPSHMTNEEISQALFLSVNTVKTHLRSAYRKLGVGSRREAIARGRRLGLLLRRGLALGQPACRWQASTHRLRRAGAPSCGTLYSQNLAARDRTARGCTARGCAIRTGRGCAIRTGRGCDSSWPGLRSVLVRAVRPLLAAAGDPYRLRLAAGLVRLPIQAGRAAIRTGWGCAIRTGRGYAIRIGRGCDPYWLGLCDPNCELAGAAWSAGRVPSAEAVLAGHLSRGRRPVGRV